MMGNQQKKVKIIATLGPAIETREMILKLAMAGVDAFRINCAFYDAKKASALVKLVRQCEKNIGRPLAVLCDLAGPKIRIRVPKNFPQAIQDGERIKLCYRSGTEDGISLNFPKVLRKIPERTEIFLGDGVIRLRAGKAHEDYLETFVEAGGTLVSGMGFAARNVELPPFTITKKDAYDAKTLALVCDAIAISFVQSVKDIEIFKRLLSSLRKPPFFIAKMETFSSIQHAEDILDAADGLMVARGDLAFSIPTEDLPFVQKRLISLALSRAKPVITATQMLESMIHNPFPTRAEVTDIANAVLDGTDALMLSAETAIGKFPLQAVRTMVQISQKAAEALPRREFADLASFSDVMANVATKTAEKLSSPLLLVFTESGATARRISRHKPRQPIIALSPRPEVVRRLNFSFGVFPRRISKTKDFYHFLGQASNIAKENTILRLKKGEIFVVSAGVPFGKTGTTNMVLVQKMKQGRR